MGHSFDVEKGVWDVGAFLTQLPSKENVFSERIARAKAVPPGTVVGIETCDFQDAAALARFRTNGKFMRLFVQSLTSSLRATLDTVFFSGRPKA